MTCYLSMSFLRCSTFLVFFFCSVVRCSIFDQTNLNINCRHVDVGLEYYTFYIVLRDYWGASWVSNPPWPLGLYRVMVRDPLQLQRRHDLQHSRHELQHCRVSLGQTKQLSLLRRHRKAANRKRKLEHQFHVKVAPCHCPW